MAEFFATAPRGLIDTLALELRELGIKNPLISPRGVSFEGSWKDCYRVNLESRVASRILKPIADFTAYQPDELYGQILRHDFTKYIPADGSLMVDAVVQDCMMHDQRFVALKVKDAIVDQFRDKFGVRPDVSKDNPDLRIWIRGYKNTFHVAIDTSGDSLYMRGYRTEAGLAPVKENLAAGILRLMEWDQQTPLVDPMCGSGTFLIEAALMASKVAPGNFRKKFAFQKLADFDADLWSEVLENSCEAEIETPEIKFYGFDKDRSVLPKAKANAKRAGVDHLIEFRAGTVDSLERPCPKGLVITNPPWALRMGDEHELIDVYRDLGFGLKNSFQGWKAYILAGNKELVHHMRLKSTRKFQVFNGTVDCRLLQYDILKTKDDTFVPKS